MTLVDPVEQACQTETTSQAEKAIKTVKGATKVRKSPLHPQFLQNLVIENEFIHVLQHF